MARGSYHGPEQNEPVADSADENPNRARIVVSPEAYERLLDLLDEPDVANPRLVELAHRARRFSRTDLER